MRLRALRKGERRQIFLFLEIFKIGKNQNSLDNQDFGKINLKLQNIMPYATENNQLSLCNL